MEGEHIENNEESCLGFDSSRRMFGNNISRSSRENDDVVYNEAIKNIRDFNLPVAHSKNLSNQISKNQ